MKKIKKALITGILLLCFLFTSFMAFGNRVLDDDMAMSIRKGDWIWYKDRPFKHGSIVVIQDPLQPNQRLIRRVIATEGQQVWYNRDGAFQINDRRISQQEMGLITEDTQKQQRLIEENIGFVNTKKWIVIRNTDPVFWQMENPITVPENHIFVAADRRDEAIDSRWWGAIPEGSVLGVVWLRVGKSDLWRDTIELLPSP